METNNPIFRKFRWFWAWDDDVEEEWLRDMSNQGFHLKSVGYPGIYTFEEGPKKDLVYRLDYSPEMKKKEDYFCLFKDAGWTYLGNMNYWQYFRKEASGPVAPEIFTDYESKIQKHKRVISLLAALTPIMVINVINCSKRSDQPFWLASTVFFGVFLALFLYGMWKLLRRINELKHF
jgi:hypothetical protein